MAGLWLAMPQLVAVAPDEQTHILLPLGLWGIAAGLVHGIGYVPVLRIWRYLFSPYAGWPLMSLCAGLWLL
ncbi:cyd operon YbgE family protein [Oceanobacter sp. 5_MG-2023]|uniref:cyd operon YbgE family protein n=1 Tax=Oceanobacter sp. 5_MG-2023 TaxID=3062645 RepID=UPI0026E197C2|nr:cyd operon YbgE family protein [Oceanobacter sp. 5_MG-2023]MDO6681919.1 cyd operon YbgE family protein [Oceanobacter sp. 5_MG-2023]